VDGKPAQQAGILPSSGLTCITVHQAGSYAWLQRAHLAAPGWEHHDCQHEALWNKGCAMGGVCVEGEGGGGGAQLSQMRGSLPAAVFIFSLR